MGMVQRRVQAFLNNRWLVLVAAIWIQSGAGVVYLFGSFSPVIKTSLSYNQRQLASLGVAKNLGDSVGFIAGSLSQILPFWGLLLVGAAHTFIGYGLIWLVVDGRYGQLPIWAMWILMFVGNNGDTYYNTASLVSCVQNFPRNRGPIVGVLKGFVGLSGAIITQIYHVLRSPDPASLILLVAIGPPVVTISVMFIIRSVEGHKQERASDSLSFVLLHSICLLLAAYLMSVMLVENFVKLSYTATVSFTCMLLFLLILPVLIPLMMSCNLDSWTSEATQPLVEDEIVSHEAEDAMKRDLRRGEDFTLSEALLKVDFWLVFFCFLLGAGSGVTVIDNLGQISGSLGYHDANIFVAMLSIWNFLGRIGGGYFSEIVVRHYSMPRPVCLAVAQIVIAVGHFLVAMAWPGALYISTLLVGLGYGAHWAIVPATTSELYGLKSFGALYNFITMANPAGSLLFSGLIASTIYDYEAAQQAQKQVGLLAKEPLTCTGSVCFFYSSLLMCGVCMVAASLSMILFYRTRQVYSNLYGNS